MFAAAMRPWYLPTYVSGQMPVTSPIAHTPSAARIRPSTGMPPRPGSTPTVARPRPAGRARRAGARGGRRGGRAHPVAAQHGAVLEREDVLAVLARGAGRVAPAVEPDAIGA